MMVARDAGAARVGTFGGVSDALSTLLSRVSPTLTTLRMRGVTAERLAILKVFQPTVISAGVNDESPDAKREKSRRLIAAAAEVLGMTEFSEEE